MDRGKKRRKNAKKSWSLEDVALPSPTLNNISVAADMIETGDAMKQGNEGHLLDEAAHKDVTVPQALETMEESETVQETVAAAEAALDRAMESAFV